ncbi:LacI family DNA-binding transcriptional regulator [Sphingobacterium humi]|uniref:Substrate-binding domain-containing protein n=1 Tax=Sphingobacterium humi TaxID=1796905 RepID=A0A6N8KSK3_9SPHI|nr:LacI family DNA-binding transcriptional regulator [Sphingobacterium humi]MVZ60405.1 substrate-binding domain-containing protein [Sphingobacterium humi]
MRITLKDIAKALNLSASSVSKALNDSHEISQETKKLVKDYAEKHHFRINKIAQTLKTGKTYSIGVILFNISNNFVAQMLDGIQVVSEQAKYDIIIMQSRNNELLEKKAIEVLRNRGVDGLLISPINHQSSETELRALQENGIPVVLIDRIFHNLHTHKVGVNNFEGAYRATKHLVDQGKKRLMHITGKDLGITEERLNGFKAALATANIPFHPDLLLACDYTEGSQVEIEIKRKIVQLLDAGQKPDAIFCATDDITSRTLGVLAELNIAVPTEIALIGFSNTPYAHALNPALSAVVQPAFEMGKLGFQKLIELVNKKHQEVAFETIALDTELHIRKSSL